MGLFVVVSVWFQYESVAVLFIVIVMVWVFYGMGV